MLPRIVLLIAVSDPALYTPPTATSHSVFANGGVLDCQCPAVVGEPPPNGRKNPTINAWLLFTVELTIVMVPTL